MSDRNGLRKALNVSVVSGSLVSAMALTTPAFADDIGWIVSDLQNSNVSVSNSASNVPAELNTTYQGTNIAVVFVSDSTNLSRDAQMILQQTDYETVIVTNGSSFGADSHTLNAGSEISKYLNQHQSGTDALVLHFDQIQSMSSTYTTTETDVSVPANSGINIGSGIGLGLGLVVLIAVGAIVLKKIFGKKDSDKNNKNFLPEEYFNNISQNLGQEVSTLRALIAMHKKNDLVSSADKLQRVDKRLGDLFSRLSSKGTQEQVNMAAIKYQDLLKKIIYIMDEHHYVDIAKNPELWNNAESRKQNSLECVEAVDKQILDNIKQLNDSQDLEFNITMQALLSEENDMSEIEELLFKNDDSGNYRNFGN